MSILDDIFLPLAEDAIDAAHPANFTSTVIAEGVEVLCPWREEEDGSDC